MNVPDNHCNICGTDCDITYITHHPKPAYFSEDTCPSPTIKETICRKCWKWLEDTYE